MLTISADPCLVAGSLVAARFGGRGYFVRRGFETHDKVLRWLAKHGQPVCRTITYSEFEQMERDALGV